MIAAVRVRGPVDVDQKTEDTLKNLNLDKRNKLAVFKEKDSIVGMLEKAKDYITYGEIDKETVEKLEEAKDQDIESGASLSMRSPKKGFKDTRKHVGQGGSLGQRSNMDELVRRMV